MNIINTISVVPTNEQVEAIMKFEEGAQNAYNASVMLMAPEPMFLLNEHKERFPLQCLSYNGLSYTAKEGETIEETVVNLGVGNILFSYYNSQDFIPTA
jgi:hypothetical protein